MLAVDQLLARMIFLFHINGITDAVNGIPLNSSTLDKFGDPILKRTH
jgi:hypothetical protein